MEFEKEIDMEGGTFYTVSRCRKNDDLYGSSHGSDDGDYTICGLIVDHNWFLTNNTYDGIITCRKCLKILRELPPDERWRFKP